MYFGTGLAIGSLMAYRAENHDMAMTLMMICFVAWPLALLAFLALWLHEKGRGRGGAVGGEVRRPGKGHAR